MKRRHKIGLLNFDQTSFDKGFSDGFRGRVWWPGPGTEPLSYAVGYQESAQPKDRAGSQDRGLMHA